ncbi:MAG: AAA family ATPase [Candidatus Margulisiibacteriota bacterium]
MPDEFKKEIDKEDHSTQGIDQVSQTILDQLKNTDSELLMTFPFETKSETNPPPSDNNNLIQHIRDFSRTPKEIKDYLDRFIVGQSNAKKALAIAICDHYNAIKDHLNNSHDQESYGKQNILMIGPTGVGKTYLIKRIAELIGVPFIKSDATKFTETGYQGGDVEDLVRQLYKKAENQLETAQFGIIYLDEIDKITGSQSRQHKDVSGRGVQTNLLKIMEDTDVQIRPPWDIQSQLKQMMGNNTGDANEIINTKHILFIMSGAFNDLESIIKHRLDGATIGFERQKPSATCNTPLEDLRTQDLVKFGLEPEFAGRMPVRVSLNPLSIQDLFQILTQSEASILDHYIKSFKRYNIELAFAEDALYEIATIAHEEGIGARALASTLEKVFREFKFELPSTTIRFLYATKNLIKNPQKHLQSLLKNPHEEFKLAVKAYLNSASENHKVKIHFETLFDACNQSSTSESIIQIINDHLTNKEDNVSHS